MEPLFIIHKCKPAPLFIGSAFPKNSMIVFAKDGIYVVGLGRNYSETILSGISKSIGGAGKLIFDVVSGKLEETRSKWEGNKKYEKLAKDIEGFMNDNENTFRYEYNDLRKFIYRKSIRFVVGNYIGFVFSTRKFFFELTDKKDVDLAIDLIKNLAPNAEIIKKKGPMIMRE